jgi:hypothetical protein
MAKYGSNSLKVEFDNAGGSLVDMSDYCLEINGIDIEAMLEESHGFSDSYVEQLFTGLKKVADVTIKGFYDDTATTGPDVIFNAVGNTTSRTLKLTWGSTKTTSVETVIKNYRRQPTRGQLTKFECVLAATGAVTET